MRPIQPYESTHIRRLYVGAQIYLISVVFPLSFYTGLIYLMLNNVRSLLSSFKVKL